MQSIKQLYIATYMDRVIIRGMWSVPFAPKKRIVCLKDEDWRSENKGWYRTSCPVPGRQNKWWEHWWRMHPSEVPNFKNRTDLQSSIRLFCSLRLCLGCTMSFSLLWALGSNAYTTKTTTPCPHWVPTLESPEQEEIRKRKVFCMSQI